MKKEIGMSKLDPLKIIVRGRHDTGKSTAANLIKDFFEQNGYREVVVRDLPPLPIDQKPDFMSRFHRNRDLRPVHITVELEE